MTDLKPKIEAEGIWRDGTVVRCSIPWPGSSTAVAMANLCHRAKREWTTDCPRLTRIFHDGALVREFDNEALRYTLTLDSTAEHRVPKKDPRP